jgi:hypothetical protein
MVCAFSLSKAVSRQYSQKYRFIRKTNAMPVPAAIGSAAFDSKVALRHFCIE